MRYIWALVFINVIYCIIDSRISGNNLAGAKRIIGKVSFVNSYVLFVASLLACVSKSAWAQPDSYFLSRAYDVKDGLPQNGVSAFTRDHNDFIWILTNGGVVRWDGRNFRRPDVAEARVIGSSFKRDYAGNLYLVGMENIYVVDASSNLQKVAGRNDSTLFFTFAGDIVFRTLGRPALKEKYPGLSAILPEADGAVRQVVADGEGSYYLLREDAALYVTAGTASLLWTGKEPGNAFVLNSRLVYLYKNGDYEVYVKGGLIHRGRLEEIAVQQHLAVQGEVQQRADHSKSVVRFDNTWYELKLDSGNFLSVSSFFKMDDVANIKSSFYDADCGLVLLGGYNTGFEVFKKKYIRQIRLFKETSQNNIYSLVELSKGTVITDRELFRKLYSPAQPWVYSHAGPLLKLPSGRLMFGNEGNIFELDKHLRVTNKWHVNSRVRDLVRIDSLVFYSPSPFGYCNPETGHAVQIPSEQFPSFGEVVRAIAPSFNEGCLYAVIGRHLYELNMKNQTRKMIAEGAFDSPARVRVNLYPDFKTKKLFLVHENEGISILLPDHKLVKLPLDPDQALLRCHHILTDGDGDYWLTSNNGLFLLAGEDLRMLIDNKQKELHYRKFGVYDGLANEEFNGGFTGSGVIKGDLVMLPSAIGLVSFNASVMKAGKEAAGRIVLDRVTIDDSIQMQSEGYILSPDFKRFEVDFSYPFIRDYNGKLLYTVEGANDLTWLAIPPDGKLVLKNMPAGDYKLRVKVGNATYPDEIAIPLQVKQYWYKRSETITCAVLIILCVLSGGYRARVRYLKRRLQYERAMNQERIRSLRQQFNPHFLQNIFSFLGHNAEHGISGSRIAGYVGKISTFYREVLVSTGKVTVRLEEELDLLDKYLSIQQDISRINFAYEITISEDADTFGVEVPGLLLQPVVENILKHAFDAETKDPMIRITVGEEEENYVTCTISDNGKGYQAGRISDRSMGNRISRERLALTYMHFKYPPEFSITSQPGAGTTVLIKIPVL